MTGRRITTGLSLLCALVFCAFAASSASAAGTTYFECASGAGAKDFKDADCTESVEPGTGSFSHVAAATKTSTKATVTQISAKSKLMGTIGGITTTLEAAAFKSINATTENSERASKEMFVKGTGEGEYTGVTIPAGEGPEGCKVKGGVVKQLSTNSESVEKSMEVEFKPAATNFAEFTLEGCKTAGLNTTYKISGTAKGNPSGANLNFTEAGTKTLKLGGQEAFFLSTVTGKMEGGNALSLTTTTP